MTLQQKQQQREQTIKSMFATRRGLADRFRVGKSVRVSILQVVKVLHSSLSTPLQLRLIAPRSNLEIIPAFPPFPPIPFNMHALHPIRLQVEAAHRRKQAVEQRSHNNPMQGQTPRVLSIRVRSVLTMPSALFLSFILTRIVIQMTCLRRTGTLNG
ncbi:hypothetical protein BO78DRAFT_220418 [Aspergillus sclerotiicarbonarius CBS 121057]|uniref:Uncharacterized protein n=1 Tax=Aspergillus sclerotiicarbonarius (strain CBS 121057 / IBT 28362) TaxID=1448318 RepID=A0A319ETA9_ASPSB|nr:hypothetical protein BO78DRAFT_220418 [Aspergillus sclerotiicarbonarius CBS 121057]